MSLFLPQRAIHSSTCQNEFVERASNRSSAGTNKSETFYASVVVFELKLMEMIKAAMASDKVDFSYIPSLLSFCELPILLKAFAKVKSNPDVIILDAQGIAHPRGIGLASHIGLLLDKPSIGWAKTRLIGDYDEMGERVGCFSHLKVRKML